MGLRRQGEKTGVKLWEADLTPRREVELSQSCPEWCGLFGSSEFSIPEV